MWVADSHRFAGIMNPTMIPRGHGPKHYESGNMVLRPYVAGD